MDDFRHKMITPAQGWWAGYRDETGAEWFAPLCVFSLIEYDEGEGPQAQTIQEVVGIDAADMASQSYASHTDAFRGYYHDSDFSAPGKVLNSVAKTRFEGGGF